MYRTFYSFSPTLFTELEALQQLHGDELDVVIASHFQRLGFVLGLYSMFLSLGEHQWRRVHTAAMQLRSQGKSFYELYAKELSVMPLWIRFSPFLPALQALERQIVEETMVPVRAMEQVMTLVKPNKELKWARSRVRCWRLCGLRWRRRGGWRGDGG
ncbi:hypothetical protein BDD12DRAFT_809487 [Trichophaea hybrida]|nr:hypothetical protein BDD12DRAFT_809487 [Trichophaea hybrida]